MPRISFSLLVSIQISLSIIFINPFLSKKLVVLAQGTDEICARITTQIKNINTKYDENATKNIKIYLEYTELSDLKKEDCSSNPQYQLELDKYKKNLNETAIELKKDNNFKLFYHIAYQYLIEEIPTLQTREEFMFFGVPQEKKEFYDFHNIGKSEQTNIDNLRQEINSLFEYINKQIKVDTDFQEEFTKIESITKQIQQQEEFSVVRSLVNKGFDEKAIEELQEIIKTNPTIEIPQYLKYLYSKRTRLLFPANLYKWILSVIDLAKYWLPGLILFILVVRLAFVFFSQYCYWPGVNSAYIRYRKILRLPLPIDINDFDYGLAPVVPERTLETIVKSLLLKHTLIGENILHHVSHEPIKNFETDFQFTKSLNLPMQILRNLVNVIIPKFSFEISGHLLERSDKGFGLSVTCKLYNNKIEKHIFWHNDYDPRWKLSRNDIDGLLRLLAEPISIWILFQLDKNAAIRWLGGDIWEISAFTYAGIFWKRKGEINNAEDLFTLAINYRENNSNNNKNLKKEAISRIAFFNLGQIKLNSLCKSKVKEAGKFEEYHEYFSTAAEGAIEYEKIPSDLSRISKIKSRLSRLSRNNSDKKYFSDQGITLNKCDHCKHENIWARSKSTRHDSIWYKAKYQLAVMHIYQYLSESLPTTINLDEAIKELLLIILAYKDTKDAANSGKNTPIPQDTAYIGDLKKFLNFIYILSCLLLASSFCYYLKHGEDVATKIIEIIKSEYSQVKKDGKNNSKTKHGDSNTDNSGIIKKIISEEFKIDLDNFDIPTDKDKTYSYIDLYCLKRLNEYNEYTVLNITTTDDKGEVPNNKYILLSAIIHYSLACYYCHKYKSRLNGISTNAQEITKIENKITEHLEFALEHNKKLVSWWLIDPSLKVFREEQHEKFLKIALKYF